VKNRGYGAQIAVVSCAVAGTRQFRSIRPCQAVVFSSPVVEVNGVSGGAEDSVHWHCLMIFGRKGRVMGVWRWAAPKSET
jgi:hypothetical protein